MYKVIIRNGSVFGTEPCLCEFICDTASDILTLPTSTTVGTGGKTENDNQVCGSGSIATIAANDAESKKYMLNNQDIWCPYSVAVGSSGGGGSSGSSITIDFALSNASENPVANKTITAALNNKADMTHTHSVDEIGADASGSAASALEEAKAYTDSEISDVMAENQRVAKALSTAIDSKANKTDIPDLSAYALKSKYGDTTIDVGRKAGSATGEHSTAEGKDSVASGYASHAEGSNTKTWIGATSTLSDRTIVIDDNTTVIVSGTQAYGRNSHAEGCQSLSYGENSHAEGTSSAIGWGSHSEGGLTKAEGEYSHAEGRDTLASGRDSHAGGTGTKALHTSEVAYGRYNLSNSDTLFSVGDGTTDTNRHNAFEITATGGKLHDKDIATTDLIPELSPYAKTADVPNIEMDAAVNADTLGGKSADDFTQIIELGRNETDTKTAVSTSTKTTIYHCSNWTDFPAESPDAQGILIAANYSGSGIAGTDSMWVVQFFISARTGVVYKRYISNTSVGSWEDFRDGGNADTLDGHHEDYFAKSNNPSIEGEIRLLREGNATTNGNIFAWENTLRLRNQDPNAENTTYTDLIVTPSGIFTEGYNNGNCIARQQIYGGRPYITGSFSGTSLTTDSFDFQPSFAICNDDKTIKYGGIVQLPTQVSISYKVLFQNLSDTTHQYIIFK